ncbi:PEP-CTERM system TPR-repeat protein PrsT [Alkalimonas collagenimarina]|uniref:PEP-CTERM system TPR-repeat protein PrsT n=1 Tax=Alkalimonas collagenimarina TaxID=400390 RepID=A0ABT9GZQ7_9GAMM|nr:XrtA/PEP-CTERM system TPR-repeat protein PrsT [Alkalimonas collagenimarina]MDP4536349.1 PEP-CTERM system TPR-repeat protein PrsT [Alkalimonas collagenimarina]
MKTTRLIPSLAILAMLTACGKKDSAEHYLDAQNFLANQQYSAAVIELRSAVQQDPDNASFRLALGLALMGAGDITSAERELERALEYGTAHEDVALPLIQSHYMLSNHSAVIQLLTDSTELSPRTQALLDSYRALSELELGDTPAAMVHLEQLAASPEADVSAFAQAFLYLSSQNAEEAMSSLLTIGSDSELYAESLFMQGKIQLSDENLSDAITSLNHYIELVPSAHLARLFLAQAYVRNDQFDEGEKHLTLLLRLFPDQPLANYLQSIITFARDDFENAKMHSEKAVRHGLVGTRARVIAALSSVQLGLESQAMGHLEPIKEQLHQFPAAQRLYAMLQLRAGDAEQARSILAEMPEDEQDLQLIASTAFELVRRGSIDTAQDLISNYQQQHAQDASSLTTLGTIKLGIESQRDAGIRDLEQALELDPSINQTRLVLAMTYLQQGEFEKASDLADGWLQDPEMEVAGYNLKAYTHFLRREMAPAMELTNQALSIKPNNPFSSLLQAMVKMQQGEQAAAKQQLVTMLDIHPTYLAGLEQYYIVSRLDGDTTDATRRIEQLFKSNEQVYPARLMRARVAHDQEDYTLTVELLNDVSTSGQTLPAMHHLILIEAHQRINRASAAVRIAERWYRQAPQDIQAGYAYANALTVNQEFDSALKLVNELVQLHPGNRQLVAAQVSLLAQLQRPDQALAIINNLPAEQLQSANIQFIKGRLELMNNNMSASLQAFQASYANEPSATTALFIADLLAQLQSEQHAKDFIEQHISQHGPDHNLQTYHANLLLSSDTEQSMSMYQQLLAEEPNNIVALNNYAWLLADNGKAEEAKPYAERAIELMPNHPDILDTYGKILLMLGQHQDALQQFEKSLSTRPEHPEVQLNYAEALSKTQQHDKARQVLADIQSDDPKVISRRTELQNQLP